MVPTLRKEVMVQRNHHFCFQSPNGHSIEKSVEPWPHHWSEVPSTA
jgi:integrase